MIHTHTLERAARYYSERPAISSGGAHTTFREFYTRVGSTAAELQKRGFEAGDRLAIFLPNDPHYIELMYACAWLGVIAVPLNTRLSVTDLDHVLADATPRGLIRHSSLPAPTVQIPWQLVIDKESLDVGAAHPHAMYNPDAILALIYTSGTTGRPKGVIQTHANVLADIQHLNFWFPYTEGGVYLHAAPIFHIMDFLFLFAAPANGGCQVTIPKFSPQSFCETVQRDRVTRTVLVPTMINMLLAYDDLGHYDLSSLTELAYGGSPVAPELVQKMRKDLPNVRLIQGYGLTEAGILTALQDREHTEDKLTSCGRACPGIDLRIADDSGNEVEVGQHGELVARGANIMGGYWNNPEETERAFRSGMFRTGDVGYQDAEGYAYILDRIKDMIVTGGEKVFSAEVEADIYELPAVHEAAVFGVPDPQWGEAVMAVVVLKPGTSLTAEEITAHCRQSLTHYKCPRRVEFSRADLPKDASGKILKRTLRERFWAHADRDVA